MLILHAGGVKFNTVIRSKMARSGERLSYDAAMEEVIADACESMLVNSQYIQELARKDAGLFDTIYKFIKRFNNQVLRYYAPHAEAQALEPIIKDVQKLWDDALKHAVENRESGTTKEAQKKSKKASQKSGAKMSDRDYSYDQFSASDYYTDGRMYDYDFLVAQKPMVVHDMPPLSDVKVNGKVSQEKAAELGLENAASVGRKVSDTVYRVKNTYTGREIQVSGGSLEHSVDPGKDNNIGRVRTNARISAIGGYVVQNGIPINGLENEKSAKTQVKGTYALACLLNSGEKQVVAIATIEQVNNSLVDLHYVDVAHAFSGRLKKDGVSSTRENGQRPTTSIYNINIADFLDIVKDTYHSILSVSVGFTMMCDSK